MKIVRMNQLHNNSTKTVAFFDMQTNDGIIIKGFRLVKDGKYYENVILPKEMKDNLQEKAIEEFNKNN